MPALVQDARRRRRPRRRPSSWPESACRPAWRRASAARRSAVGSVMACGVSITSRPSLFGILGGDLDGLGVALRAGVAEHVDGIVVAPVRRAESGSAPPSFRRTSSASSPPLGDQRVGGQHAGAAGVGDDRQARALGARLLGEHLRHVEQVGDAVHAQHAACAGRRPPALRRCRSASRCARRRPWRRLRCVRP